VPRTTIEVAADLGGMVAAIDLFLPIPLIVVVTAAIILALQISGSYELILSIFRWLALALLAYVGSAILVGPEIGEAPGVARNRKSGSIASSCRCRSRSSGQPRQPICTCSRMLRWRRKVLQGRTTEMLRQGAVRRGAA
jgi:hypothetical protein